MRHARSLAAWICALGVLLGAVWCVRGTVAAEPGTEETPRWTDLFEPQTTRLSEPADLKELKQLFEVLGIDMSDEELRDLVEYVYNGGKVDDWLKANKDMGVGSWAIDLMAKLIGRLTDWFREKYGLVETTTKHPGFTPPPRATTTVKPAHPRTAVSTERFYPVSTTARPEPTTARPEPTAIPPEDVSDPARAKGDVDGDGHILARDARLALRVSAKLVTPDAEAFRAADVDGDGQILAKDARQILRFSAKLISSFQTA